MARNAIHPSDQADKFMLRLPNGMRDRIKDAAEQNGRSMNSEIVMRLESSLNNLLDVGSFDLKFDVLNPERYEGNLIQLIETYHKLVRRALEEAKKPEQK